MTETLVPAIGCDMLALVGRSVAVGLDVGLVPNGASGRVASVSFDGGQWCVELEIDPPPTCADPLSFRYEYLEFSDFLRCCRFTDACSQVEG
jgi:hypothetical protein